MADFDEGTWQEKLALAAPEGVRVERLTTVRAGRHQFDLLGFVIGSEDRTCPTFGIFGGVHGLERVGAHVVMSFLESLFEQLVWDGDLQDALSRSRIVCIPIVNPGGMFLHRRSNPNGVDLMRNAPVEAEVDTPLLVGGHRLSPKLPWYRGRPGAPMEAESHAMVEFVRREVFPSRAAQTLDVHSGFGVTDRLWFPYAKNRALFPDLPRVQRLKELLDRSYPNHVYLIEPQSSSYTTNGDLWDLLYDEHRATYGGSVPYIPWTLEMGSWTWVRKNPRQILTAHGPFNPIKPHRYARTMRRHLLLIDFLRRSTANAGAWSEPPSRPGSD
ncbi:MAG: M14 family zinc carboxypeptidase [Planctomycetota bacterium]|jgi:hypothetical protein